MLFSGKKQFVDLFAKPPKVKMGLQQDLPDGWPLSPETKVFVCPSSSGRVVMKKEEIMKYYCEAFKAYNSLYCVYWKQLFHFVKKIHTVLNLDKKNNQTIQFN